MIPSNPSPLHPSKPNLFALPLPPTVSQSHPAPKPRFTSAASTASTPLSRSRVYSASVNASSFGALPSKAERMRARSSPVGRNWMEVNVRLGSLEGCERSWQSEAARYSMVLQERSQSRARARTEGNEFGRR
jgi:hypothetical protein